MITAFASLALLLPVAPPARAHHCLAYDPGLGKVVLHGGSTPSGNGYQFFNDLWSWDGNSWELVARTGKRMSGNRLVHDGRRLLSIGGYLGAENCSETSAWIGGEWVVLDRSASRSLSDSSAVYDSVRKVVVLFGGSPGNRQLSGATWEWNGEAWTSATTQGPPPRQAAHMAFDAKRGKAVLFGGGGEGGLLGDTWEWDGRAWAKRADSGPAARASGGFVFDEKLGKCILFGGMGASGVLGDTWTWDGSHWQELRVAGPPARAIAVMAYDSKRGVTVLFGGRISYPNDANDTWEFDGKAWARKN